MGNRLGDLISRGEGGYNSFNRGSAGDARGATIDFSQMTIGEVQDAQHLPRRDPDRLFAVGKYQIIPSTMDGAANTLHLDRDQRFTPELQERIFSDYLIVGKRPDIHGYITDKSGVSLHDAQEAVAAEWASVADPDTGRSKYGGVGNNRASISADQVAGALNAMRQDYQAAIQQGKSPQEAWRQVTEQGATQSRQEAEPARARDAMADGLLRRGENGAEVRAMQERLNELGYRDAEGKPLRTDGDFGRLTEEALRDYQRDHGLKDDGVAGPKTLEALKHGEREPLISDSKHPGHELYKQALDKLDPKAFKNRQEMEQAAGTVAFEARVSGLSRIDHVAASRDGKGLFAIEGQPNDPGHHRVYADKEQASQQSLEHSTQLWQQDAQQRAQLQEQTQQHTQQQQQEASHRLTV